MKMALRKEWQEKGEIVSSFGSFGTIMDFLCTSVSIVPKYKPKSTIPILRKNMWNFFFFVPKLA